MHVKRILYLLLLVVLSLSTRLTAQSYADSTIVYLEWVSDPARTMVINWIETDTTGVAQVYYRVRNSGTPWKVSTGSVIDIPDATVKRKSVRLTGLTPNTEYGFRIGLDSLSTQAHFFRTMPINLNSPVNFIVTGDVYGDGTDPVQESANFIESAGVASALDPYFMVMAGDLIHLNLANEYNATTLDRYFKMLSEYTKYMKTSGGHYIPLIVGLGNHELPQRFGGEPADAVFFNALFSFPGLRGYNTLDFSDYLSLIMLNTDHTARIQGEQTDWLETQLSERRGVTNVFPVYHVAAYPGKRPIVPGRGYEVRQHFSPLFEKYNIRFAFEHDNHGYKRTQPIRNELPHPCGVRYIGEGGFAIPLGPVETSHNYLEQQWNVRHIVNVEISQNTRRIQTFAAATGFLIDVHSQNTRLVPPSNLVAQNVNANSFTATWNPNCVADSYRLDVSTDPNFATFLSGYQNRDVGTATSVTLNGLQPLTTYYYRVRAVNSFLNQTTGNSNTLELTTSSLPPGVNPATNITSSSFTANWNSTPGADQYYIDVSTESNFSTNVTGFDNRNAGNSTSISVTGLISATTYFYRIRAGSSLSTQASENSSIVGLNTLPETPVTLQPGLITSTGFTLKWNPVVRADQYFVDISTDSTFASFLSGFNSRPVGNVTEIEVSGVSPLTRYYYRIRARNSMLNVTSVSSSRRSVITPSRPPVVGNATNVTTNGFIANWQSVQGATRYFIDVATDPEFTQYVTGYENLDTGNTTSLSLTSLMSATSYYYRVRASNSTSGLIGENSDIVSVITLPETPIGLAATNVESRSFIANWSSVDRINTYLLDVSTDSLFNSFISQYEGREINSALSVAVEDLSPNTMYYYRVRGILEESSVTGAYSNMVQVITTLDVPDRVVAEAVGSTEITFNWDESENAEEYFADLALNPQFTQPVSGFENFSVGSVTQATVDGLNPVERYFFRVRASSRNDQITSDFSAAVQVITNPSTPLLNPASEVKAIGFTAVWGGVERVSYYELDVAYDEGFLQAYKTYSRLNVGDGTEHRLEEVLPGTTLYFRVRAVNTMLQVSSEWSEIRSVSTLAIDPVASSVEVSKREVLSDGSDSSEITVTVRDGDLNPLQGVGVELTALSGTSSIEVLTSVTGTDGVSVFRVSNTKAEYVSYRATAIETVLSTQPQIAFIPVSPVAISATQVLASSFRANWNPVNGAESYRVDVSTTASFSGFVEGYGDVEVVGGTQLLVEGLFPGDEYFYRVRAVAPTGVSVNSNVSSLVTIQADPVLTGVEVVQEDILSDGVTKGSVIVTVRGTNGQPMRGVPVRLETTDTRSVIQTVSGISDENGLAGFEITSDFAGKVSYRVYAGRVEINSRAEINFVPLPPVARTPDVVGATEVSIGWERVKGVIYYELDLALDENFQNPVSPYDAFNVGDTDEMSFTRLNPATAYYFRVLGGTATARSDYSTIIAINTLPESPTLSEASEVKAIGFTAVWGGVERVSYYELDVAYDEGFLQAYKTYSRLNVGDGTEHRLEEVLPGTTLYFRVRAVNTMLQVSSEWSEIRSVSTLAIDPVASSVEVSKREVLSDGSDSSEITVTVRDGDLNPLQGVGVELTALSGTSSIEVLTSVTGTDGVSVFRVSNTKAEYVSYRATAIETVLSTQPQIAFIPVSPVAISATQVLASSFRANWNPVNGAESYRVDVSTTASFSGFVEGYGDVEVVGGTQLLVEGLFPGDEYFYRVRAVAPTGVSVNSNVSSLVTIQADPVLTGVEVVQEDILSDGVTKGSVIVTVRGTNGQPMRGVPVRLETTDTRSVIQTVSGISDENGLAGFEITSDFAGKVSYRVYAGRVEINSRAEINFVPLPPVARTPDLLGAVEFTAVWEKVNGATHYLLDIALKSNFENLMTAYTSLNVGDVNEFRATGLAPGTNYFYRIRGATPTAIGGNSNTISVTTYQIDLVNSKAISSSRKILANGEQKAEVEIKLINEEGNPLPDVQVYLIPDESVYTIKVVQEVTDSQGIARFNLSSLVAGEGIFTVSAGGLELESKVEVIFLFADGEMKLGYNFPNPFGSITRIPITIPERMNVTIDVYNSFGQRVAELESKEFLAGYYEIPFSPRGLSSGVYIARMIADGKVLTQKMMFVK